MKPVLTKETSPQALNKYRKDLHEDLYPQNQPWTVNKGNITSSSTNGTYVRMGRMVNISVVLEGPVTVSVGGYFDIPFVAAQSCVLNLSNGTSGFIDSGTSRVYLTAFGPVGRVVVSGLVTI